MTTIPDMTTSRRGAGDAASRTAAALVGRNIARVRKERGMTQSALARALGVSQPMVSHWENGEVDITLNQLARIAWLLHTKAATLAPHLFDGLPADGEITPREVLIAELQDITRRLAELEDDDSTDQ